MKELSLAVLLAFVVGCGDQAAGTGSAAPSGKPAGSTAATTKPTASAKPDATATATAASSSSAAPADSAAAGAASDAIKKMLEDVQANEANYKDKPVKVDGLYLNTNEVTSGGKKTYNIILVDSKDDKDNSLTCDLGETKPPEGLKQYDAVSIEGKGSVANVTKGDKKMKSLSFKECKVTKK
jgi:hypothetical protein